MQWSATKFYRRIVCWLTKHRYDIIRKSGWERMEWTCSKCGENLVWFKDATN
jgi:hypothetical protein